MFVRRIHVNFRRKSKKNQKKIKLSKELKQENLSNFDDCTAIIEELIYKKYKSKLRFAKALNIPYSTLKGMFMRGIGHSSINLVLKLCAALDTTVDELFMMAIEKNIILNKKK